MTDAMEFPSVLLLLVHQFASLHHTVAEALAAAWVVATVWAKLSLK